jgi:hypothetical protein
LNQNFKNKPIWQGGVYTDIPPEYTARNTYILHITTFSNPNAYAIACHSGIDKGDIKGQLNRMNGQKGKEVWEYLGLEKRADMDQLKRVFDRLDTKGDVANLFSVISAAPLSQPARQIPESDAHAGKGFVDQTDIEAIYRKIGYKCKAMTEYGAYPLSTQLGCHKIEGRAHIRYVYSITYLWRISVHNTCLTITSFECRHLRSGRRDLGK